MHPTRRRRTISRCPELTPPAKYLETYVNITCPHFQDDTIANLEDKTAKIITKLLFPPPSAKKAMIRKKAVAEPPHRRGTAQ